MCPRLDAVSPFAAVLGLPFGTASAPRGNVSPSREDGSPLEDVLSQRPEGSGALLDARQNIEEDGCELEEARSRPLALLHDHRDDLRPVLLVRSDQGLEGR